MDEKGERVDAKITKAEIPKRIEAALESYRRAALRGHLQRLGGGGEHAQEMGVQPHSPVERRKLPFGSKTRVVPVAAAASRAAGM